MEIVDGPEKVEKDDSELKTDALIYDAINEIQMKIREEVKGLLAKYSQIIFKDEKSATKTYLV